MHFLEQILSFAKTDPEKLAIIYENDALTFAELAQRVASAQGRLAAQGIKAGQMVALAVDHPLHRMPLFLALAGMGVTTINCTGATALPTAALGVAVFLTNQPLGIPRDCQQISIDAAWFSGSGATSPNASAAFAAGQAATVWFSSGSTGYPRYLALTWESTASRVSNKQWWSKTARFERTAIGPSLATTFGCTTALAALASGSSIVLLSDTDSIIQIAELLAFDYLVASTAQTQAIVTLAREKRYRFHTLRGGYFGGGNVSDSLAREALTYLCRDMEVLYGASEAGAIALIKCARLVGRNNCVGRPLPTLRLRIVDARMQDAPAGTEGEIIMRNNESAIRNWGLPPSPGQGSELWIRPGDRGYLDASGELFITGRMSDVINLGGDKIAPERIEDLLRTHPYVRDAAALGVMSLTHGIERLHVLVVADGLSRANLLAWWQDKVTGLALDEIRFVEAIPRTQSGKIERYKLKELVVADNESLRAPPAG